MTSRKEWGTDCTPLNRNASGFISDTPCNGSTHVLIDLKCASVTNAIAFLQNFGNTCPVVFTIFRKNRRSIEKTIQPNTSISFPVSGLVERVTVTCSVNPASTDCSAFASIDFTQCYCCKCNRQILTGTTCQECG